MPLNSSCGLGHQHTDGGCSPVSSTHSTAARLSHRFLCMKPMEDGKCPLKPTWASLIVTKPAPLANANLYLQLGRTNVEEIRHSLYFQFTVNIRKNLVCLALCIGSMANRDCMEINELYKGALTVLMMNIENTVTSATSGKPDEQAALAFPLHKKIHFFTRSLPATGASWKNLFTHPFPSASPPCMSADPSPLCSKN